MVTPFAPPLARIMPRCATVIALFLGSLLIGELVHSATSDDLAQYQGIIARLDRTNPVQLYNLGTLSLRIGKPGEAVAYLERARRLSHFDNDIQNNLAMARRELAKHLGGESSLDPASTPIENLADRVTLDQVRGAIGLASLLLVFFWLRAYRRSGSLRRTCVEPAGLFTALGLLVSVAIYIAVLSAGASPPAAALTRTPIRSGPGENYLSSTSLDAGVIVRLTGESLRIADIEWTQIRFSADQIGWVKSLDLLALH